MPILQKAQKTDKWIATQSMRGSARGFSVLRPPCRDPHTQELLCILREYHAHSCLLWTERYELKVGKRELLLLRFSIANNTATSLIMVHLQGEEVIKETSLASIIN